MTLTYFMFLAAFGSLVLINFFVKSILLDIAAFFVVVAMIIVTSGTVNVWLSWGSAFLLLQPMLSGMKKAGISF